MGNVYSPLYGARRRYSLFDFTETDYDGPKGFVASGKFINTYLCPSDPNTDGMICTTSANKSNRNNKYEQAACTTMAGVADSINWTCDGFWPTRTGNGMLFNQHAVGSQEVIDGLSNTLFVGEVLGPETRV